MNATKETVAAQQVFLDSWVQLTTQLYQLLDTIVTDKQRAENDTLLNMAKVSILLHERRKATGE